MSGYPPQHPSAFPQPHPNSRYGNPLATGAHHSSYIRPPSTQPASLSVRPPDYAAPSFPPFMTPAGIHRSGMGRSMLVHQPPAQFSESQRRINPPFVNVPADIPRVTVTQQQMPEPLNQEGSEFPAFADGAQNVPGEHHWATRGTPAWPSPMRYGPSLHPRPVPSSSRAPTFPRQPQFPVPQPFLSRRKKALIIGINYTEHRNPKFRLKYCVDDAYAMAHFLRENFRFQERDIHILVDGQSGVSPTKANILNEMGWLVRDARPNDSLFFYFSGHAKQIEDQNWDEADGFDECICAMDYRGNAQPCYGRETPSGLIIDDEMHDIMVKPLPEGCRLTAIFDCCHSGSLLDLPYVYSSRGMLKRSQHPNRARIIREKGSPADVVSLSACKDEGTAVETDQGGALRSAFIECMSMTGNQITYCDLVWNLRTYMEAHRFMQRPQLSSSHKIDTNRLFIV